MDGPVLRYLLYVLCRGCTVFVSAVHRAHLHTAGGRGARRGHIAAGRRGVSVVRRSTSSRHRSAARRRSYADPYVRELCWLLDDRAAARSVPLLQSQAGRWGSVGRFVCCVVIDGGLFAVVLAHVVKDFGCAIRREYSSNSQKKRKKRGVGSPASGLDVCR